MSKLALSTEIIANRIGYAGHSCPRPVSEIIKKEIKFFSVYNGIQGGFKIIDGCKVQKSKLLLDGHTFNTGRIISSQLVNAESIALFLVTAGKDIDVRVKTNTKTGDTVSAYITDTLGSEMAEKAANLLWKKLKNEMSCRNLNITNRFSPGYCQWPVSEQQVLFSMLPKKFCKVTLNSSSLMVPVKSISGIIGIGSKCIKQDYICAHCKKNNCMLQKI